MKTRSTILAALALAFAAPVSANAADALAVQAVAVDPAQEGADFKIVQEAIAAFQSGGFPALGRHIDRLKAVAGHAPASYPKIDRRGRLIIVHVSDQQESLALTMTALMGAPPGSSVSGAPNVYPLVFQLLGFYAQEQRNHEEAVMWLDRGLKMQPYNPDLTLEKATALLSLHRAAEGAAIVEDLLKHLGEWPLVDRSRIYRNLGISYADIDKFDQAEAALNESIRLQPNNPRARQELEYVKHRRAGAPAVEAGISVIHPTPEGDQAVSPPDKDD